MLYFHYLVSLVRTLHFGSDVLLFTRPLNRMSQEHSKHDGLFLIGNSHKCDIEGTKYNSTLNEDVSTDDVNEAHSMDVVLR